MNNIMVRFFIAIFLVVGFSGCNKHEMKSNSHKHTLEKSKVETFYTCSMHPQIRENKPGKCPICHMNLTKIEVEGDEERKEPQAKLGAKNDIWQCKNFPEVTSAKEDVCPMDGTPMVQVKKLSAVAKVKLRKSQLDHFKPDYFTVTTMKMGKKVRLLGTILQSEEKKSSIPARIEGRVEKVYIKSTGSFVSSGDPVVDFYSPRLISAGEEYLLAKKSYQNNKSKVFREMMNQSEERLKLWGIKKSQYNSWYKNKKIPRNITIYSSSTGIVSRRNATKGKYFKEGQNLFELSDLSDIWVEMDVYEQDASLVKLAQRVKLKFTSLPGQTIDGEIDFVSPVLDSTSRTLKIRTTIKNKSGKLKPGMVADATLEISIEGEPLVIPRNCVIDTGKRKVAWVKISDKSFQAKTISTGYESEGFVEVKSGLDEGEKVVMEGNFLLDAQAQLFGGYSDVKESSSKQHNH